MAYQARVQEVSEHKYEVWTDAPPETISEIGLFIYHKWLSFALGGLQLNGKMILNPTGKLARSISIKQEGPQKVAILQDEKAAPEGWFLEAGTKGYDFKQRYQGRTFPLHRPGGIPFSKGKRVPGYMWSASRAGDFAGFATVGKSGWVIPPMPAYHPVRTLAHMGAERLRML